MGFNCECLGHISVGSGNFPINFHEFLWFPMGRGIEKLKTHHFFTNLSSPHLFTIVAMVFELVVADFRWFSMVWGIGKLKTHHLCYKPFHSRSLSHGCNCFPWFSIVNVWTTFLWLVISLWVSMSFSGFPWFGESKS